MALQRSSRRLAAVAAVLLVALSGCAGMPFGADDMSAEEISEKVEQQYQDIGTYTGTVTTEMVTGNETRTTTANVWVNQSSGEMRYEYVSPERMNGTVLVSNGSTMWMYNETTDTARKTDVSKFGSQGMTNFSKVIRNVLENYNVSYAGTETVGDRSTHVLSMTPKNGSEMAEFIQNYTLWVDKDNWFPVKRHSVSSFGGETYEVKTTYTNVTFDADVPADVFEFEPPADAEVTENTIPDREQYESVGAADEAVPFEVTEPQNLPDGYELGNVTVTSNDDYSAVSLSYENETETLTVTQSNRTGLPGGTTDSAENVTVGNETGTYTEFGDTAILRWTCGGESYTVTGSLSKSELVAVAESVDCA